MNNEPEPTMNHTDLIETLENVLRIAKSLATENNTLESERAVLDDAADLLAEIRGR